MSGPKYIYEILLPSGETFEIRADTVETHHGALMLYLRGLLSREVVFTMAPGQWVWAGLKSLSRNQEETARDEESPEPPEA